MATVKLIVKSAKKGKLANLYIRYSHRRDIDISLPSGFHLPPEIWSNKTETFKRGYSYSESFTQNEATELLNNIYDLRNLITKEANLNHGHGDPHTKEWLKKIIFNFHNPGVSQNGKTLNEYITSFISDIELGKRVTPKNENYKPLTVKNFKGFETQFKLFQTSMNRVYNFNDITIDFYDDFLAYFKEKDYSPNTIGRHVKNLKTVMNLAHDEGLHANTEHKRKKFKTLKVEVTDVYLSETELQAILELNLSDQPQMDLARDIFLAGCYTAQRFSDYSKIRKDNFKEPEPGRYIIDLTQSKTGERVIIPVRPELLQILKKYDFELPRTFEQKVNKKIKDVARLAGITEPITIHEIRGGLRKQKTVDKCELVKTHTARRSGCTNMYLAGIPSIDIMKISGHRTEREFLNYIKVTKEETARNLHNHPYFNHLIKVAE